MTFTIEHPTAEELYEALKTVPQHELVRLGTLILKGNPPVDESTEWSDEDLRDFSAAGDALYEELEDQETDNAKTR